MGNKGVFFAHIEFEHPVQGHTNLALNHNNLSITKNLVLIQQVGQITNDHQHIIKLAGIAVNVPYLHLQLLYVLSFLLARSLHQVCLMVYKKSQTEIFVGTTLFTGNSKPLFFDGFWAVTDRKMAQSESKIKKCELILNVNGLPAQKNWNICS